MKGFRGGVFQQPRASSCKFGIKMQACSGPLSPLKCPFYLKKFKAKKYGHIIIGIEYDVVYCAHNTPQFVGYVKGLGDASSFDSAYKLLCIFNTVHHIILNSLNTGP